jgi:ABC-2 type transport system permease protein
MGKFFLIAKREYLTNVRRRSFLLATFGFPILMIALMAASALISAGAGQQAREIGYVDESGVLAPHLQDPGFQAFPSVPEAQAGLRAGTISAFYHIPKDYLDTGKVQLVYRDGQPGAQVQKKFDSYLKANLVAGLDPAAAARAIDGPSGLIVRNADGSRQADSRSIIGIVLPFAFGFFLAFALMSASSYLLRAISEEKESRMIEVMVTSLSPTQLVAGKAVGLVGVALTQVILWAAVVIGGLAAVSRFVESLGGLAVPWSLIGVLALYLVPMFALAASMAVAIGVNLTESNQDQQVAMGMSVLFLLPLGFTPLLFSSPDGPAMVALTFFPTTSPLTVAMRWGATVVPLWQLVLSLSILSGCAVLGMWGAPRVFRAGMLHYGRRMSLRSVLEALRTSV